MESQYICVELGVLIRDRMHVVVRTDQGGKYLGDMVVVTETMDQRVEGN